MGNPLFFHVNLQVFLQCTDQYRMSSTLILHITTYPAGQQFYQWKILIIIPRLGGAYCFRPVRSQRKSVDWGTMGPTLGGAYECYAHISSSIENLKKHPFSYKALIIIVEISLYTRWLLPPYNLPCFWSINYPFLTNLSVAPSCGSVIYPCSGIQQNVACFYIISATWYRDVTSLNLDLAVRWGHAGWHFTKLSATKLRDWRQHSNLSLLSNHWYNRRPMETSFIW